MANVGDSSAFLDTGSEVLQVLNIPLPLSHIQVRYSAGVYDYRDCPKVYKPIHVKQLEVLGVKVGKVLRDKGLQVSGNHRLDDNKSEQERIKGQGFEVSSSRVEGRPCGPLRVWPGGLAMGRTLGDFDVRPHPLCPHSIQFGGPRRNVQKPGEVLLRVCMTTKGNIPILLRVEAHTDEGAHEERSRSWIVWQKEPHFCRCITADMSLIFRQSCSPIHISNKQVSPSHSESWF